MACHFPVDRGRVVRALDISERTLARLEADGVVVPVERGRRGRASVYDLEQTARNYLAHLRGTQASGNDERAARARRDLAQAKLSETRAKLIAAQLVPADEAEQTWGAYVEAVRAKLLAIPGALADSLARATNARVVSEQLTAAIHDTLRQLARGEAAGNGAAKKLSPAPTRSTAKASKKASRKQ